MAVSSINPWAAGAVVFDQRPYEAFYERQMAKKQAKEDALENYFRDLGKNITPTGMRNQDIPGLMKRVNESQQYFIQNKDAILHPQKDNGAAYSNYMSQHNDKLAYMDRSKNRFKTSDELNKIRLDPKRSYLLDDVQVDDPNNPIHRHDLPLDDSNSKELDLAEFATAPKPIDVKDLKAHNDYLTGGVLFDKVPGKTEDIGGFKTRTPMYQQYGADSQKQIAQHARNEYDTDKRWRLEAHKYWDQLIHDPIQIQQLNNLYKPLYGQEIENAKEAWAAKGILDNNMKATSYETGKDEVGWAKFVNDMKEASDKRLIDYKKKIDPNDTDLNNVWYAQHLHNIVTEANQNKERHHVYNGKTGESYYYYNVIKPDTYTMQAFKRGDREPDRIGVTDKGDILPIFFKYDKDGNKVKTNGIPDLDYDYSVPQSYEQALVNMGYRGDTKKALNEHLSKLIPKVGATTQTGSDWKSRATKIK